MDREAVFVLVLAMGRGGGGRLALGTEAWEARRANGGKRILEEASWEWAVVYWAGAWRRNGLMYLLSGEDLCSCDALIVGVGLVDTFDQEVLLLACLHVARSCIVDISDGF